MKLSKLSIAISLLALSNASVFAEETYNFEVGLAYSNNKDDSGTKVISTIPGVTYYFTPVVKKDSEPFDELDFLQRSSHITFGYGLTTYETDTLAKTNAYPVGISGTFYANDFLFEISNISFNKFNLKSKTDSSSYLGIKPNTTTGTVGYFILPNSLLSYEYSDGKISYSPSSNFGTTINDIKTTSNSIISHSIISLENSSAVSLDLKYSQIKQVQDSTEKNSEYSVDAKYYPKPNFYINAGYTANTGDNQSDKGKTMLIGFGFALNHDLHLTLGYEKFNGDVASEQSSSKTTTVGVIYRF